MRSSADLEALVDRLNRDSNARYDDHSTLWIPGGVAGPEMAVVVTNPQLTDHVKLECGSMEIQKD